MDRTTGSMNYFFNLSQGDVFVVAHLPHKTNLSATVLRGQKISPNMSYPRSITVSKGLPEVLPEGMVYDRYVTNGVDTVVLQFERPCPYVEIPAQRGVKIPRKYIADERTFNRFVQPSPSLFMSNEHYLLKEFTYNNHVYPQYASCVVTGYYSTLMGEVDARTRPRTFSGEITHFIVEFPEVMEEFVDLYTALCERGA